MTPAYLDGLLAVREKLLPDFDFSALPNTLLEDAYPDVEFTVFPKLPLEIRFMIWEEAADADVGTIVIEDHNSDSGDEDDTLCSIFRSPRRVPALIHTCHESRAVCIENRNGRERPRWELQELRNYTQDWEISSKVAVRMFVNFDNDRIYAKTSSWFSGDGTTLLNDTPNLLWNLDEAFLSRVQRLVLAYIDTYSQCIDNLDISYFHKNFSQLENITLLFSPKSEPIEGRPGQMILNYKDCEIAWDELREDLEDVHSARLSQLKKGPPCWESDLLYPHPVPGVMSNVTLAYGEILGPFHPEFEMLERIADVIAQSGQDLHDTDQRYVAATNGGV